VLAAGDPMRVLLQDARLNTVMKNLTAWAAIIAVPTRCHRVLRAEHPLPPDSVAAALYLLLRREDWRN
jgi:hypothetical protein